MYTNSLITGSPAEPLSVNVRPPFISHIFLKMCCWASRSHAPVRLTYCKCGYGLHCIIPDSHRISSPMTWQRGWLKIHHFQVTVGKEWRRGPFGSWTLDLRGIVCFSCWLRTRSNPSYLEYCSTLSMFMLVYSPIPIVCYNLRHHGAENYSVLLQGIIRL